MTKKAGIIGWPVAHSISPAMHNAAFAALGLDDWHYDLLPTPADMLAKQMRSLIETGYVGANVTIPYKQTVIEFLDNISLAARSIGAVNTIVINNGRVEGYNTDSPGFTLDLEANGVHVQGQRALVLGAGGSAHAVVLGLANRGAHVTIIAHREATAWQLRERLRSGVSRQLQIEVQPQNTLEKIAPTVGLIVNCTPVGMWPEIEHSPWPDHIPIPGTAVVYDLIYRPAITRLMQQAAAAGARTIGGLGMLVYQGAAAFELWTGHEAPVAVMFEAAQNALVY
jgi:shikimate dehydrogenase